MGLRPCQGRRRGPDGTLAPPADREEIIIADGVSRKMSSFPDRQAVERTETWPRRLARRIPLPEHHRRRRDVAGLIDLPGRAARAVRGCRPGRRAGLGVGPARGGELRSVELLGQGAAPARGDRIRHRPTPSDRAGASCSRARGSRSGCAKLRLEATVLGLKKLGAARRAAAEVEALIGDAPGPGPRRAADRRVVNDADLLDAEDADRRTWPRAAPTSAPRDIRRYPLLPAACLVEWADRCDATPAA